MRDIDSQRGVLATALWKVVPPAFAALLVIWILVGIGGFWMLERQNAEILQVEVEQQAQAVARNMSYFFDSLRSIADNTLIANALSDPSSAEQILQPVFRSFRIGKYRSLSITMADASGRVVAWDRAAGVVIPLPSKDVWLSPAMQGREVFTIEKGSLVASVPIRVRGALEGAILMTLSSTDTRTLLSPTKSGVRIQLRDLERGVAANGGKRMVAKAAGAEINGEAIQSAAVFPPDFPWLALSASMPPPKEPPFVDALRGFLLIAFLADLAALAFGIYMTAHLIARPLNGLVTNIESMQKLSDPEDRLPVEGPIELRNLSSAFNRAADRQAELTFSLEQSLAGEKEINRMQREFVSLVSHEFRTPLAIIDGQAQRVIRKIDRVPKESILGSMEKCRSAVARLIELIESVLSSSKLEAGTIDFRPGLCRLRDLVDEVARNQEEISPNHRIMIDIDSLPDVITADERLLRQVFTNLISNAVKYSPGTEQVWVEGYQEDGDAVIAVRDRGVGIPEKEIGKLFGRFFRASTATGIPGTGIGLNLVKQLVDMHKGSIAVTSATNKGSTFTVRLKLEPAIQAFEVEAA